MHRMWKGKTFLFLTVLCMLIFVRAPRAWAYLYRAAMVHYAFWADEYYCAMTHSLAIIPGSPLYLFVEYDPLEPPTEVSSLPACPPHWYPLGAAYFLTPWGDHAPVMDVGSRRPSDLRLADSFGSGQGMYYRIAFIRPLSDAQCNDHGPRERHGVDIVSAKLYFAMQDTKGVVQHHSELPIQSSHDRYCLSDRVIRIQERFCHCSPSAGHSKMYVRGEPLQMMIDLVEKVMELNINSGISNALNAKLESALEALDTANERHDVSACNRLQAFINSVEAQRTTHINDTDADELIADAQEIITTLSCQ